MTDLEPLKDLAGKWRERAANLRSEEEKKPECDLSHLYEADQLEACAKQLEEILASNMASLDAQAFKVQLGGGRMPTAMVVTEQCVRMHQVRRLFGESPK
jgi:hypothetical protein